MSTRLSEKVPLCKVTSIYFNYYQAERELQHNPYPECGLNVMPEDINRFPTTHYNAVAFAMDATDPTAYAPDAPTEGYTKKLKVHAEFNGPPNRSLLIRTIDPAEQKVKGLESYLTIAGVHLDDEEDGDPTTAVRLLGDIQPVTVTFNEKGNSYFAWKGTDMVDGVVELTIDSADIWSRGVFASWQLWQWQYSADEGKTWDVVGGLFYSGISVHRVFITKDLPTWPWTGYDEDFKEVSGQNSISRPPYIGALEWACKWAKGETTVEGIASKITAGLNDGSGHRFKYEMTGANNYTSLFNNYFDCGRFIDRLNGKFGRGPNVNCVDCAHMVISLANALGCNLQPGRIQNPGGTLLFKLNPLTLIGHAKLTPPNKSFGFHQVAVCPGSGDDAPDCVYDACIKFDMDIFEQVQKMKSAPDPKGQLSPELAHRHPVDIPIGSDVFSYGYLALLAKPLHIPSQVNLSMETGDAQNFSINALKFY